MHLSDPHIFDALKAEFNDKSLWQTRGVVLTFGVLSGLTVVAFTWLTEHALALFHQAHAMYGWLPLLWTPLCTAGVVWATRRWAPGAAGSGIPQVMAALQPRETMIYSRPTTLWLREGDNPAEPSLTRP